MSPKKRYVPKATLPRPVEIAKRKGDKKVYLLFRTTEYRPVHKNTRTLTRSLIHQSHKKGTRTYARYIHVVKKTDSGYVRTQDILSRVRYIPLKLSEATTENIKKILRKEVRKAGESFGKRSYKSLTMSSQLVQGKIRNKFLAVVHGTVTKSARFKSLRKDAVKPVRGESKKHAQKVQLENRLADMMDDVEEAFDLGYSRIHTQSGGSYIRALSPRQEKHLEEDDE